MARGRREAALALHRAQLAELDRDLAEGRLADAEHAGALLEVQRRLLVAADSEDMPVVRATRFPLIAALTLIPALALSLYLINGMPDMPAAPHAQVIAEQADRDAQEGALITQLRTRLEAMDPRNEQTRQGYLLLGNAEASRRNMPAAAAAWRMALEAKYDPTLAAETAEALTEAAGRVTDDAAKLFRGALEAAPKRRAVAADGGKAAERSQVNRRASLPAIATPSASAPAGRPLASQVRTRTVI